MDLKVWSGFKDLRQYSFLFLVCLFSMLFLSLNAFAAHPLITDDTGTQGKGKSQIEVNSEFNYDKEKSEEVVTKETGGEVATIFSYGAIENVDIILGLPYQWKKVKEDGEVTSDNKGISDASLEIKWRFFEKDGLSLALKPSLTFPTGDENKGLSDGRMSYGLLFIATKETEPWGFHFNLGYTRKGYKLEADKEANRKDIWHVSFASTYEIIKDLKLVADIGVERNPAKASTTHPAYLIGGLIYSIKENFDVNFGVKTGLNKPETDRAVLAGIAFRF